MSLVGYVLLAGAAGQGEALDAAFDVIQERCFECHAAGNVKGGLRLDAVDGWKKSIDTRAPADSELVYRLRLPADDVDAMPPKGGRVDDTRVAALEAWMEGGADLSAIDAFLARAAARDAEQSQSIALLAANLGASVTESLGADGWSVNWSHLPTEPTVERVQRLEALAERVVEISFAGTAVTNEVLVALPELPLLRRVHLERTRVTDDGVAALVERAPKLHYLNLHSTAVTANLKAAVPSLGAIPEVILFGTKAAPPSSTHPFARIVAFQPRRLLCVDRATQRVVLLREVGLDTYELLWEHDGLGFEGLAARWLGGTRSEGVEKRKGIDDGHGRVAVQLSPTTFAHIDTRSRAVQSKAGSPLAPPRDAGARAPWAHGVHPQRLRSGHRVMVMPWNESPLPEGAAPRPQIVEKNAAGEIVWTFTDVERFPQGFRSVQVIERTR